MRRVVGRVAYALGVDPSRVIWSVAGFLIFLILLASLRWGPLGRLADERVPLKHRPLWGKQN
jgi:hypothetical protein